MMQRGQGRLDWSGLTPAAVGAGFVLLVAAWIWGNPPGAAADEPEHYVRALSVSMGTWIGAPTTRVRLFAEDPERTPFLRIITRDVPVPPGLAAPASWSCFVDDHKSSGACLVREGGAGGASHQSTYQGVYPPFYYVLPGVAMRAANDPLTALLVGRAVTGVIGLGLLLVAAYALWDRATGSVSLLGLGLAVSPTVLSVAGTLSTSGVEIPAGLAAIAIILRLARGGPVKAWTSWALAVAAVILVAVRPLGPVYAIALLGLGMMMFGPARLAGASGRSSAARVGLVAILAAAVANVIWDRLYLPQTFPSWNEVPGLMVQAIPYVSESVREMIGVFGQTDTLMPSFAYALWGLSVVGLIAAALQVGSHRQRRQVEAAIGGVFLVGLLLALQELPTGFGINGRQLLPLAVGVPLLAGEVINLRIGRAEAGVYRWLVVVEFLVVAAVQLIGWYANAHRVAVGTAGSWWFLGAPEWSPPAGWATWFGVAAVGSACLTSPIWGRTGGDRNNLASRAR